MLYFYSAVCFSRRHKQYTAINIPRTSDLIFFNSGALPNILHYITLHLTKTHTLIVNFEMFAVTAILCALLHSLAPKMLKMTYYMLYSSNFVVGYCHFHCRWRPFCIFTVRLISPDFSLWGFFAYPSNSSFG